MVAIVSSLKEEISGILKDTEILSVTEEKSWRLFKVNYNSRELLLLKTGMGKENTILAVSYVLEKYPVSKVISLGFAGALIDDLKPGDLVFYSQIIAIDNPEPIKPDVKLLSLIDSMIGSKNSKISIYKGHSFTSDHIVYEPDQKRKYKEEYGCIAVDMESYWVGYASGKHNVPFVCMRAISDTTRQRIPKVIELFGSGEKLSAVVLIRYLAMRPSEIFSLFSLCKNAYLARKSLTMLFAYTINMLH